MDRKFIVAVAQALPMAPVLALLLAPAPLLAADDPAPATEPTSVPTIGPEGDEPDEEPPAGGATIYLPLQPSFVVNYGGPGRLKYLKADITVRLANTAAANSVRHHLPYIRNNLVMLFASQTDASLESQAGKEALRREALQEVRDILMEEDKQTGVVNLYFDNFIIQR